MHTYENAPLARYRALKGDFIGAIGEHKIGDVFEELGEIYKIDII